MTTLAAFFSASRFIHIAAVMQLFGIGLFTEYLAPSGLRSCLRLSFARTVRILACISLFTALFVFMLQGGQMGEGWQDTFHPAIWLAMLQTDFGLVWIWHIAIALAAVIIVAGPMLSARRQQLLLLAVSGLLITFALTGHTAMSTGLRGGLQRGNQILHLFSAAWWLGCLVPLLRCIPLLSQALRPVAIQALIRFSRSGHAAVALVILTGIVNSCLIIGQWPPDLSSVYQRMLLIKIAVVALMVILAITNRYRVVPMMARHHPHGLRYLSLLTLTEVALGMLVLILVSVFATLEP